MDITPFVAIAVLISLLVLSIALLSHYDRLDHHKFITETCPTALPLFDKLDWNKDGFLCRLDLEKCQYSHFSTLSAEERQLAGHLQKYIETFNHVTGESVWVDGWSGKRFLTPEYGISKADLERVIKERSESKQQA